MTTTNPAKVFPPVIVPIYEGTSAKLKWSYSLTSKLNTAVLKFDNGGIVTIRSNGQAGEINVNFRDRFTVSSTDQSASLLISRVTVDDDKDRGEFRCDLIDSVGETWKRVIQVQVIGKIKSVADF